MLLYSLRTGTSQLVDSAARHRLAHPQKSSTQSKLTTFLMSSIHAPAE